MTFRDLVGCFDHWATGDYHVVVVVSSLEIKSKEIKLRGWVMLDNFKQTTEQAYHFQYKYIY